MHLFVQKDNLSFWFVSGRQLFMSRAAALDASACCDE